MAAGKARRSRAFTWTVKDAGLAVVLKETLVEAGAPVTLVVRIAGSEGHRTGSYEPIADVCDQGISHRIKTKTTSAASRRTNIYVAFSPRSCACLFR